MCIAKFFLKQSFILQFKSIILEAQLQATFTSEQPLTVFVFNDAAYSLLPPYRQTGLYERNVTDESEFGAAEYVNSFTSKYTRHSKFTTNNQKLVPYHR